MTIPVPDIALPLWQIRLEEPGDAGPIEALNAESFGPGRFAKSAYRLREGVHPVAALSFVAVEHVGDKEVLRGSVRFWPKLGCDGNGLWAGFLDGVREDFDALRTRHASVRSSST